jgi:alpha-amylase/alpha-mannosidase (GH57 family)
MRYVCIHGHFYQPPRENPWLDTIEVQDSAAPYHDWNARVTAECYWPNAAARLLGHKDRIAAIVNNYASLSFNFGPTLTSWFARHEPELLTEIVAADRVSQERHAGHGNAIAQAYGHAILPLATPRDQETQVAWGVREFVHRFGRAPVGMWLPETAVDVPTLETLAAHGLAFTILAPHQAKRIRPLVHSVWQDTNADSLETRRPYLCRLPSGKQIVLFFYDAELARGVAFERLLDSGDRFSERLMAAFRPDTDEAQLVHLATDGETYGHHHRFGEMALTFALHELEQRGRVRITNYGEYLALHPPQWEVEIHENTSWSCAHGVERWRANCGCHSGGQSGWTQEWRAPLRAALNWLQDTFDPLFEQHASALLRDPWAARNAYIDVLLERTTERIDAFFNQHASRSLGQEEKTFALRLLEMQHHRLLMFTSCGWFFDEISGLEATQILRYAARAIEFAKAWRPTLEAEFVDRLRQAPSNIREIGHGGQVYLQKVKPSRVDFPRVVANQAICRILEPSQCHAALPTMQVTQTDYEEDAYGATALGVGRMTVTAQTTLESQEFVFAVLKFSGHDVHCVVSNALVGDDYTRTKESLVQMFSRHSLSEVVRALDRQFGETYYTARDLLLDDRRRVLARISEGVLERLEATYLQLYRENRRLMEYLYELDVPLPQGFTLAAGFLVNRSLSRAVATLVDKERDGEAIEEILSEARKWRIPLATSGVEGQLCNAVEGHITALLSDPLSGQVLTALHLLEVAERLGVVLNLWWAQTVFARVCHRHLRALLSRRRHEEPVAHQVTLLHRLGERLGFCAVEGITLDTWDTF